MPKFQSKQVAIIGGGITGLTTALALNKLGIKATVYEKAESLEEVGAGIWMQPNALHILNWLGLGEAIGKEGHLLRKVELTHRDLSPVRKPGGIEPEGPIVSIHRGRLQKILRQQLPADQLRLGDALVQLEPGPDKVNFRTCKGWREADLVLAADGIHSKVRSRLFPESRLRYSGQTCWRGIAQMDIPKSLRNQGMESWGPSARFGCAPISENEIYWFAVQRAPEGQQDDYCAFKMSLLDCYQQFDPLVGDIIAETPMGNIHRHDIHDLARLETWHEDKICLIGDAAHAATPNMGQGGGQGIEDAYYMARFLRKNNVQTAAFQEFETHRRPKVDYVVNTSWRFGQLAHQRLGQWFTKLALRMAPEKVVRKQFEMLYSVQMEGWE